MQEPQSIPEPPDVDEDPAAFWFPPTSEWLCTDGVGGYASSTRNDVAARRYHGLLCALPPGHSKRHLFLGRLADRLKVDGVEGEHTLTGVDTGPGSILAQGLADRVMSSPIGSVLSQVPGIVQYSRRVRMPRGAPTVLVEFLVIPETTDAEIELELRPYLPFRETDALTFANDVADLQAHALVGAEGRSFRLYDALPTMALTWELSALGRASLAVSAEFIDEPEWLRGIRLRHELQRGYDGHEDHPSPGRIVVRGTGAFVLTIAATLADPIPRPGQALSEVVEEERCSTVREAVDQVADDFLYRVPDTGRLGICAGYPWFGEWGRDTFIALPGLTLARGDVARCQEVLAGALPFLSEGLLPNIYGRTIEDSHYGSVDASLWYARAAELYAAHEGADPSFVKDELQPAICEIADAYRDGTGLGVGADAGMLIAAGGPELNATWMDARASDGPVTPRDGCAVEINALWIALLDFAAELCRDAGDEGKALRYDACREVAAATYVERLWLSEEKRLADRWLDGEADRRVRPNMVIAAALARSPLSLVQCQGIVDAAEKHLLTARGLRTLAPSDPAYVPQYRGSGDQRDRAYHQGTVWPWLLGFYTEACLRARGVSAVAGLRLLWDGLGDEVLGLEPCGHIHEVFDGDAPHLPGGTIAQAWNSAELLRSYDMLDRWEAAGGDPETAR